MAKFHMKDDGTPGSCVAQAAKCPKGSDAEHYNSAEEARAGYETQMAGKEMGVKFTKDPHPLGIDVEVSPEAMEAILKDEGLMAIINEMDLKKRPIIKPGSYSGPFDSDEDGQYCGLCEESTENCAGSCKDNLIFSDAEFELSNNGITFHQRRVMDGAGLLENDALLVLAQGELSLKGFNARVRKLFEADRPGKTFKGWGFNFEFGDHGPYDGSGKISSNEMLAPYVASALYDVAMELDAGKYRISTSHM